MLVRRIGSTNNQRMKWDTYQWNMLAILLEEHVSFVECMKMLLNKKQSKQIEKMTYDLENGISMSALFIQYFDDDISRRLSFYTSFLNLPQAIHMAHHMYETQRSTKSSLLKSTMYPLFLIVFSYSMFMVFAFGTLPFVIHTLQIETQIYTQLIWIQRGAYLITILLFVMVVYVSILFLLYHRKAYHSFFSLLHVIHLQRFMQVYVSYTLAQYLLYMTKHGISTKQSIHILQQDSHDVWIAELAKELDVSFCKGNDFSTTFSHVWLDPTFVHLSLLGYHSNRYYDSLSHYQTMIQIWFDQIVRKLNITIQCIAYSMVGVLVILVYQMMLYPLELLESW